MTAFPTALPESVAINDPTHRRPNATFIIVAHTISDPSRVQEITRSIVLPAHLTLHQVLPNAGGTRQVCLWEAADVGAVEAFVEPALAGLSSNTYFAVEAEKAMGPTVTTA